MLENERNTIQEVFNAKRFNIKMLFIKFNVDDLEHLVEKLNDYIKNDFEYIIENDDYMKDLNHFFLDLFSKIHNNDEFYLVRNLVSKTLDVCKSYLKPYNKKEKKKDIYYAKCNKLKELLTFDLDNIDAYLLENDEAYTKFKVIKFIVFELKNPDYLFRIIQEDPNIVNITNRDSHSLFECVTNYYLDNVYTASDEDIKYYKRILMLLLESDCLSVKNQTLKYIVDKCDSLNSFSYNSNIKYLKEIISRHFPNLSGSDKINCVTYTHVDSPFDIVSKDPGERKDLRDVFTITIDGLRNSRLDNTLFDHSFSLIGSGNDLHILVSIPDVDLLIDRNSEIDSFMRTLGESVYLRNYKKALLEYKFAKTLSLEKGKDKNALTFDVNVDSEGNIKGIDFYESIIRVNYNLTKDKCDHFMMNNDFDERLNVLNKMYDLAAKLCRKRKEVIGRRSPAKVIMDEFNILPDLQTAKYFNENGIVFPYKNYFGKLKNNSRKHIAKVDAFIRNNNLDEESSDMLYSLFNTFKRPFYDTIFVDNKTYHGAPCGSVGNPMREYISLESDRLIKDLVINNKNNEDYWKERIERDCIEYTETSAKIKELYEIKRGR